MQKVSSQQGGGQQTWGVCVMALPATGGRYDSAVEWRNLYSSFPLRDPLTDISVSQWGLKLRGGPRGRSCCILYIQGSDFFHEPRHFVNTQN